MVGRTCIKTGAGSLLGPQDFIDWVTTTYQDIKGGGGIPQARKLCADPNKIVSTVCDSHDVKQEGLFISKRKTFDQPLVTILLSPSDGPVHHPFHEGGHPSFGKTRHFALNARYNDGLFFLHTPDQGFGHIFRLHQTCIFRNSAGLLRFGLVFDYKRGRVRIRRTEYRHHDAKRFEFTSERL
jgi:hypothetical protein